VLTASISAYGVINHLKTFSVPSYISGVSNYLRDWGQRATAVIVQHFVGHE